jgi:hypothetical protein
MKIYVNINELEPEYIEDYKTNKLFDIHIDFALNALCCYLDYKEIVIFNFIEYFQVINKNYGYNIYKTKNEIIIEYK